jgi:diguanylate cyclase (GGDEF)-like protein
MRKWNLPARICAAIANSHKIDLETSPDAAAIMDRCVALSGPVAELFLAAPDQRRFAEVALAVERSVALDKAAFGQVLATIGAIIPETEAIFDASLVRKQDADLILEQAREVLLVRSLQALRDISSFKDVAERSYSRALDLEEENRRDALTGTYNRAHFDQFLQRAFEHAERQGSPLSIAFADLDNFKAVNDTFGHQAGDRILQTTARVLRENTRETDLIARYGGEEFIIVLPATDADTARRICDRIVCALQLMTHEIGENRVRVTISIGCSTLGPGSTFANGTELVKAADQALYTAKMRGRNRAVPFDHELPKALARFV